MYENIGGKMKTLAKIMFYLMSAAVVFLGITLIDDSFGLGLLLMGAGPLVSWICTWFLYGFGELIEKAGQIEYNTRGAAPGSSTAPAHSSIDPQQRLEKMEKLRAMGLITEEEYQQAISKN